MADRCYYCETDRVDHRHGDGHSCGDCCGMHGMLTHPDYKDGEYKWVAKCIKAKNARIAELEAQLAALDWREITETDLPEVGVPVLVVWNGCVQKIAYVRTGIGFACTEGYVWETAYDIGYDPIPDGEVTHYAPLLDPPPAPRSKA